ncbi:radical SAM protein [Bradyrhizobium sp.]|uniref:radical SAM protein n=1 Tax=Bradyrhizobium sp. TaxID=376 RepID=UPI00260F9DA5|nr:radical SAM protein [Bradyrhizobium sp.]
MTETGQWDAAQSMGRRWPIGCVALEITQRCNLDCGACYLSEHSEAVRDLPLEEVYRRIDMIRDTYGSDVDVQVTGGDPTLRKQDELVAIVRRLREVGMRPTLFTNGIRATRDLLVRLVEAGLVDVAFHVDLTQGRRGYQTEGDLNELRRTYIERARGLPLSVFFNTTVFDGNFDQIPNMVAFFVQNSDVVRLASFQPQAQTGRGALDTRSPAINTASVIRQIEEGLGTPISFSTAHAGHRECNRYAMTFVANGHVYDVLDNSQLYNLIVARTAGYRFDRQSRKRAVATFLRCLAANPEVIAKGAGWFASKLWRMKSDLIASCGRINKLSFFVHNFMDACNLDPEWIKACTFMAATPDGPVSMCLHNAQRDHYILRPLKQTGSDGEGWWDPVTGQSARNIEDLPSHGSLSPAGLRRKKKALGVANAAD